MIQTTFVLAEVRYALLGDQDVDAIKAAVVRAAQAGGGFVEIRIADGRALAVLVTPGVPLLLEGREVFDAAVDRYDAAEPPDLSWIDFD